MNEINWCLMMMFLFVHYIVVLFAVPVFGYKLSALELQYNA